MEWDDGNRPIREETTNPFNECDGDETSVV